jgi:hypothetical protein
MAAIRLMQRGVSVRDAAGFPGMPAEGADGELVSLESARERRQKA